MRIDRQQFGVVAPHIEDIRALTVRVDDRTLVEDGVLGSFQLQERTVRLLDPTSIGRRALPRLFAEPFAMQRLDRTTVAGGEASVPTAGSPPTAAAPAPVSQRGPVRILFAEDTKFFREHVARTLRGAGFEVVATADGELAWQQLEQPDAAFDIVVTDVQMPVCDGLELTRRIRRSERHLRLPVIALTSLSSAEHESEGIQAGVSTYLVKLDDAALIAAVRQQAGVTA
jgi:CheY-like chemotaxis protein